MVFLIAYATFEVPANMMLKRFSPSVSSFARACVILIYPQPIALDCVPHVLVGSVDHGTRRYQELRICHRRPLPPWRVRSRWVQSSTG